MRLIYAASTFARSAVTRIVLNRQQPYALGFARALLCLFCLSIVAAQVASAATSGNAPTTPWKIDRKAGTWVVTWHSDIVLPIGNAAYTVRSAGRILGIAREQGNDAVATLKQPPPPAADLELWRGEKRIDNVPLMSLAQRRLRSPKLQASSTQVLPSGIRASAPGPYATERLSYDLAPLSWREFSSPIEVVAEVTYTKAVRGPLALVLVLHGRHGSCYRDGVSGEVSGDWPCVAEDRWQAIPSHRGYRAMADLLASQGHVVVSIAANGINGQDFLSADGGAAARSALVRHHLALWARWSRQGNDPWRGLFRHRIDLHQVVLIGHSRGGEGVARAVIDSRQRDPWRVRALLPIGPTAFGAQAPANVTTAVLLPYCDGDVSDLQGQLYVDGTRDLLPEDEARSLRTAIMVYGANHNFFNAEWTPGLAVAPAEDDFPSGPEDQSWCSPFGAQRLAPGDQQQIGAHHAAALVSLALRRDRSALTMLDMPANDSPTETEATAIGGDRLGLWRATAQSEPLTLDNLSVDFCQGNQPRPFEQCNPRPPHWPSFESSPGLSAYHLTWQAAGQARFEFRRPIDLRRREHLDLRIAPGTRATPSTVRLRLIDVHGGIGDLATQPTRLGASPGPESVRKAWARTVRGDLGSVAGIDLRRIAAVELALDGQGDGYVFDLAAAGSRLNAPEPSFLPLLDVDLIDTDEGDQPNQLIRVPVRISGEITSPLRYAFSIDSEEGNRLWRTLTLQPGTTSFTLPVRFNGDDIPTSDRTLFVTAYALRNGYTRNYLGGVRIKDNETYPRLSVESATVSGTEATGVTINFLLDHPVNIDTSFYGSFVVPTGGVPEIDSLDVSADTWQSWSFGVPREPAMQPSAAEALLPITIPQGTTRYALTIPFETDGIPEGTESFEILFFNGLEGFFSVSGTVSD